MFALEIVVDRLDITRHIFGCLVTIGGLLCKRMLKHLVQGRWITSQDALQGVIWFVENLLQDRNIIAGKRQTPGEHPVEHNSHGPDIGSSVRSLAQKSLRRDE